MLANGDSKNMSQNFLGTLITTFEAIVSIKNTPDD